RRGLLHLTGEREDGAAIVPGWRRDERRGAPRRKEWGRALQHGILPDECPREICTNEETNPAYSIALGRMTGESHPNFRIMRKIKPCRRPYSPPPTGASCGNCRRTAGSRTTSSPNERGCR